MQGTFAAAVPPTNCEITPELSRPRRPSLYYRLRRWPCILRGRLCASASPAGRGSSGIVRILELGCQQVQPGDHIQDSLLSERGRMGPCAGVYDGHARRRACKAASARAATAVNDLRVDGARVCEPGALHVPGAALAVGAAFPPRVEVKNASARPMRSATVRSVKTGFGARSPQPRRRGHPCSPALRMFAMLTCIAVSLLVTGANCGPPKFTIACPCPGADAARLWTCTSPGERSPSSPTAMSIINVIYVYDAEAVSCMLVARHAISVRGITPAPRLGSRAPIVGPCNIADVAGGALGVVHAPSAASSCARGSRARAP